MSQILPPTEESGFSSVLILLITILLLAGAITFLDLKYIAGIKDQNVVPTVTPVPGTKQTPVTARGTISKDKYSVNITLHFMLEGGSVTGEFSGTCEGNISGHYDGGEGGAISGTAAGSCDPFLVPIPASGTFSGTVDAQNKTIPLTGTGSAAGFSGSGSLTLTF